MLVVDCSVAAAWALADESRQWTQAARAAVDDEPDGATVMSLARTHRLTVYDAAYLELAMRRELALCTLDDQLIKAAPISAVNLWSP